MLNICVNICAKCHEKRTCILRRTERATEKSNQQIRLITIGLLPGGCNKSRGYIKERKLLMGLHLKAMGRHLPYGITQCYLLPDTSERAPP